MSELDYLLSNVKRKIDDFQGLHKRRKDDVLPTLPSRSPELSARIERVLAMNLQADASNYNPPDPGALAAVNDAIMRAGADTKAPYAWKMRIKRWIAHHVRTLFKKIYARIEHWSE